MRRPEIVSQLATGYEVSEDGLTLTINLREGVTFHDGTPLDAEAVRYNLERSKTLPGSNWGSELEQLESVEVVDSTTVQLNLEQPFAPLVALLADRAGTIVSPSAAEEAGEDFGNSPVCAGPFQFSDRVAQDQITLERFPDYWDAESINVVRNASASCLPTPRSSLEAQQPPQRCAARSSVAASDSAAYSYVSCLLGRSFLRKLKPPARLDSPSLALNALPH